MSAPAVKPALPTSGAQPPRVGAAGPPAPPNANPPPSATAGPKLPPNPSSSPVKPTGPANANHAMSSAVPLSLVQDHKAQSNALAQPPVSIPRTPEKTKDHLPPAGPKPTSNGVEGSPNKAPMTVSLPSTDNKKPEEPSQVTPILNHSTDSSLATPMVNATPASVTPGIGGSGFVASVPPVQQISSTAPSHQIATQQSPAKQETPPAAAVPAASAALSSSPSAVPAPAAKSAIPNSSPTASKPEGPTTAAVPAVEVRPATAPTLTPTPAPTPAPAPAPAQTPTPGSAAAPAPAPAVASTRSPPTAPAVTPAPAAADVKAPATASVTPPEPPAPKQAPTATPPSSGAPASGPGPGPAPAQESSAKPAPPAPPEVTKTRIEVSKPEFKVATPRVSKRKRETKPVVEAKSVVDPNDDRKSKRVRTRTQPYQSPLPEIPYMAKIKNLMKNPDDKLIVFYKNEFLAVRNAEGSFYVCQSMQNIYKSSTRIRIRWLSQEKKENKATDVYIPDFYDITEFDCILTNLELKKLDKNKFQLPQDERERTQSILKRALDVEKGVAEKPPITEEHPDGLDLSLYRNEDQLKKKRSSKKGKKSPKSGKKEKTEVEAETSEESQDEQDEESEEEVKKKKQKSKSSKKEKLKASSKEKTKGREKEAPKRERTSERERGREREREAAKRRAETPSTAKNPLAKPPPEKKAKVSTSKPTRKSDKPEGSPEPTIPTRSSKSRSAKSAAPQPSKSSPTTRTKERERRSATTTQARKKPGKKA